MSGAPPSPQPRGFPRPSAIEWACLVIGSVLAFYYSWILDDAYIYYRYVDNFVVHGRGLVYNEGEFVEGFSSAAWALVLSLFRWLGLTYWTITKGAAVVSFVMFWALLVFANHRLSAGNPRPYIVNFPLIHLSLTYGVLSYCSSGLETPLILVVAAAYACFFLAPESRLIALIVGTAPLIRHELALPYAIAFLWFIKTQRRFPLFLFASCLVTLGGWLLFRVWYYADLFPNTYYLKDEISIWQGLRYVYDTVVAYHTVAIGVVLAVVYAVLVRRDREHDYRGNVRLMLLVAAALVTVYVIKIGGDPRHFRYLAFPYCVAVAASGGLIERLLVLLDLHQQRRAVLTGAAAIALLTVTCYPRQLVEHPIFQRLHELAKDDLYMGDGFRSLSSMGISDATLHRLAPDCTPPLLSNGADMDIRVEATEEPVFATLNCVTAYRRSDQKIVHKLGLTEPFLARTTPEPTERDRTAHKWGLLPFAQTIKNIRLKHGFAKGAFRKAVEDGSAAKWVEPNLETLEAIEAKAYNEHDFFENLGVALTPVGRVMHDDQP